MVTSSSPMHSSFAQPFRVERNSAVAVDRMVQKTAVSVPTKTLFTDSYGNVHMQPVMVSYNQEYDDRPIAAYAGFQIVGRVL